MRTMIRSLLKRHPRAVAAPSGPRWVEVTAGPLTGGWLFLDTDASPDWQREMAEGSFDPFIYEVLGRWHGVEGMTFWDVGAHIGYHSLSFANLLNERGRVISFEPNAYNVERFRLHLGRNPKLAARITLLTTTLSNIDGEASFEFSPVIDDGTSSGSHLATASLPADASDYVGFKEMTVKTLRADSLLRELPAPTVMKIDVEGAEQMVLEGASEILTNARPLLFLEVHSITQMFYVQKILLDARYTIEILDEENASPSRCFIVARP